QYPKARGWSWQPGVRAAPAPVSVPASLDGKRDAHPAAPGLDPAGAAARHARCDVGQARLRRDVRRRADRLLRLPDVPDVRLVLRAAVGSRPAPRTLARLPRL